MRHFIEGFFNFKKRPVRGFTLAELLIALAILGQISIFTIPKIISAQQNAAKKAVFKETIAALSAIMYEGRITGNITVSTFKTYMFSKINAVKICNSNSATEGCFTHTDDTGSESDGPGFVLHNGATVAGFENCCDDGGGVWSQGFIMDWNGAAGPNLVGDDQIWLEASFGTAPTVAGTRPGTIGGCKLSGTSQTMFKNLFN